MLFLENHKINKRKIVFKVAETLHDCDYKAWIGSGK